MEIQPDLSVCLLHSTPGSAGLTGFLESLYTHADPVSFEAIIVANARDIDDLAEVEREFPGIVILENLAADPLPKACNHAWRLAQGRYLSLWDESLRIRPNCLKNLIDFLEETPEAGIIAPRIVTADGLVAASARTTPGLATLCFLHTGLSKVIPSGPHLRAHLLAEQDHLQNFEADWLLSEALVLRRDVLDEVGFLDEGFARLYADADYCLRARRAGWHLHYLAEAVVSQGSQPASPPADSARILADCTRFLLKKWLRPAQLPA